MSFILGMIVGVIIGVVIGIVFCAYMLYALDAVLDTEIDDDSYWDDALTGMEDSEDDFKTVNVSEMQLVSVSLVEDDTYPFPTPGTVRMHTEQGIEEWEAELDAAYDETEEEYRVFGHK